jgi:hypothetical protein
MKTVKIEGENIYLPENAADTHMLRNLINMHFQANAPWHPNYIVSLIVFHESEGAEFTGMIEWRHNSVAEPVSRIGPIVETGPEPYDEDEIPRPETGDETIHVSVGFWSGEFSRLFWKIPRLKLKGSCYVGHRAGHPFDRIEYEFNFRTRLNGPVVAPEKETRREEDGGWY